MAHARGVGLVSARPRSRPAPARWRAPIAEAVGLLAVLALAAGLRADGLMLAPAFTDESMEVLLALDHLAAGHLNLVGVSSFLGGLHTWLLMAVISLSGGAPEGPRALSLAAGLLTVLLTHTLGRALGGPWAGLLAGGLLAVNLPHVVITSRIAWSNCATPLFATACLLCLTLAIARQRPAWLVPAAVAAGLALQTHPSAAALLPGLGLGVLLAPGGRGWLRTRWPWLAAGGFALAYANVIWFNLTTGGKSLAAAQERDYAVRPADSPAEFTDNLLALAVQFGRNLGSSFDASVNPPAYPITPTMVGVVALAAVGAVVAVRRGHWPLPVVLLTGTALMALIGGEYLPLPRAASRYLAPLWPPALVLAGLGGAWLGARLWRATHAAGPARAAATAGLVGLSGLCLALLAQPAQTVRTYDAWYAARPFVGTANRFALEIAAEAATRGGDGRVYLDTGLHEDENDDAGTMFRSLSMLLRLQQREVVSPRRSQRQTRALVWEHLGGRPGLAVLRRDRARQLTAEGARLTPVGAATRVLDPREGAYQLYEVRSD